MSTIYKMLLLLIALSPLAEVRSQQLRLAIDSVSALQGNQVEVALRARNFVDMLSAQSSIAFDPQIVQFDTVTVYGLPGLTPGSFSTSMVSNGKLTFSWDDASLQGVTLPDDSALFKLQFSLIGAPGTASPLHFSNSPALTEFTDTSFSPVPLDTFPGQILVEDTTTVGVLLANGTAAFSLQIFPHPIVSNSVVEVELQMESQIEFQLWGMDGRQMKNVDMRLAAGKTNLEFARMFPGITTGNYFLVAVGEQGREWIKISSTK